MKKAVIGIIAVVTVLAGGAIWFGYQRLTPADGSVLGVATSSAFWDEGILLLSGERGEQAYSWRPDNGMMAVSELEGKIVEAAAASPDEKYAIVAIRDGRYAVLWKYTEGARPEFLVALRGSVQKIQFSENGRYAALIEKPQGLLSPAEQVSLYDTEGRSLQHISGSTRSMEWLSNPDALVTVDHADKMWYHELALDGRLEPPKLLGDSQSNIISKAARREIFFVKQADGHAKLIRMEISNGDQLLVTELETLVGDRPAVLYGNASGTHAVVLIPDDAERSTARVFTVDLRSGEAVPISSTANDARWFSEDEYLIQRETGVGAELWKARIGSSEVLPVSTEGLNKFAS